MLDLKRFGSMLLVCLGLVACQPNDDKTASPEGTGRLQLMVTDAPFNYDHVAHARVTITKIELRHEGGSYVTVFEENRSLDLIELKNGLTETLADVEVPVGTYDQVRLVIEESSVELKDGTNHDLKVPSGASSGLKVFVSPGINVVSRVSSSLLLDFDLSRSFVALGPADNITGFHFKPVIRASNLTTAGSISGHVESEDDVKLSGALVTISNPESEVVATAVTDEEGFYMILGLPEGSYTVTVSLDEYATGEATGVTVVTGNDTKRDMTLDKVE